MSLAPGVTILVVAALIVAIPPSTAAEEPLALVARMEAAYAQVRDYTATFAKRERVRGVLLDREVTQLKFQRPFRVYLRWLAGPKEGREVLYAEGVNGNRMLVSEPSGFRRLFTFLVDPRDDRALRESRHPITDIGIGRLIGLIADNVRRAVPRGELTLIDHGPGEEGGRQVRRYEGILPDDPARGYFCARLLLAVEAGLPVRVVIYEWGGELAADYAYTDLQVNRGLGPEEFDPANPAYRFPRWRLAVSR